MLATTRAVLPKEEGFGELIPRSVPESPSTAPTSNHYKRRDTISRASSGQKKQGGKKFLNQKAKATRVKKPATKRKDAKKTKIKSTKPTKKIVKKGRKLPWEK
jgi:hypothetical protein